MANTITPRVLKGFRDFLPESELERRRILGVLEASLCRYGYVPIDTPVLEYTEVLLGKAGGDTEKQIYRFTDHGGRDVAMRFDLTVPFARYIAGNRRNLYLPFKRYHIGKVYRGENTQRGRYREFAQCDFDTVGVDSPAADFDILLTIAASFRALGIGDITIRVSHRGLLNGLLARLGVQDKSVEVLRTVDKLGKIGEEETRRLLIDLVGDEPAGRVLAFVSKEGSSKATLDKMIEMSEGDDTREAAERMRLLLSWTQNTELAAVLTIDPSITRGLDYYTGVVFETVLNELPEIGSVCGGGRYNDLASLYTKEQLPGVGGSIGVDRLIAALTELGRHQENPRTVDVLVLDLDDSLMGEYFVLAERLRAQGFRVDVYPEQKKLGAQFAFAERKGIPAGVLVGPDEVAAGTITVKDLITRENHDGLSQEAAMATLGGIVQAASRDGEARRDGAPDGGADPRSAGAGLGTPGASAPKDKT